MDKESQTCGVCSLNYNTTDSIPRVLNCAHTICSHCLNKIINTPDSGKCPFDSLAFNESQRSLENFPLNFALLALLEGQKQNICQVHGGELTNICFQDRVKICSDCALFGEHKGHPVNKIKELKAKVIEARKDLEERLENLEKNPSEKNQEAENLKNSCMDKMGNRFGEINKILKDSQLEWRKQMEKFFERNMDSRVKEDASKALEEIDQAFQKEDDLVILNQDFNSIISRLELQVAKEEVSKLSEQTSRMINRLESFLTSQAKSLKNFDLSNEEELIIEEIQLSSEKRIETQQKPGTLVSLHTLEDSFCIEVNNPKQRDLCLDADKFPKMKQMVVKLEGYQSFFKDPADLNYLSQILNQFKSYTRLSIEFQPLGLNDDYALQLFKVLFCRIQDLTSIEINLGECDTTDEPFLFFCENILPKAISLKYLTLKLNETKITNQSLVELAKSLAPLNAKLQSLTIQVAYTGIQDDGIEKIFDVILGVQALRLYLEGTDVTDRSLKMLGNMVMPEMKNLKKFSLNVKETEITIEGANAIFTGIPNGIRVLNLNFENGNLSGEVISLFEQNVCSKLQFVKDLSLRLEGSDLEDDEEV